MLHTNNFTSTKQHSIQQIWKSKSISSALEELHISSVRILPGNGMEFCLLIGIAHNAFLVWIGKTLDIELPLKNNLPGCIDLFINQERGRERDKMSFLEENHYSNFPLMYVLCSRPLVYFIKATFRFWGRELGLISFFYGAIQPKDNQITNCLPWI